MADPYPIINLLVVEALLGKEDFTNESRSAGNHLLPELRAARRTMPVVFDDGVPASGTKRPPNIGPTSYGV